MRWLPLLLLTISLLVFGPGLRGDFVWDDTYLIEENPDLRQSGSPWKLLTSSLWQISGTPEHWIESGRRYFRPFVKLAYWAEFRAFGTNPAGYHAVSLCVHAACVLLAFLWLRRRLAPRRAAPLAAAFAAALFALHPSRPEAVSWISGCADLWMTFWVLLGLVAWDRRRWCGSAALAGICFGFGLLCKEVAAVVPLALALDVLFLHHQPAARRAEFRRLAIASALLVVLVVVRLVVAPVSAPTSTAGTARRGTLVAASTGHYMARLVWPWRPSTQIGLVRPNGQLHPEPWSVALGALALLGVAVLAGAARRRPAVRPWLADLGWFAVPLLPVLNVVPLGYAVLVAERFLYLPLLGASAAAGRALAPALERGGRRRAAAVAACGLLLVGFAATSMRQISHLASNERLWRYELENHAASPLMHLFLAKALWKEGRRAEAMQAAYASYARAVLPQDRAEAAVTWASIRLETASDAEQRVLARIRDFLDAVATGGSGSARLDAVDFVMTVELAPEIASAQQASWSFRNHRALAHARTLSFAVAERELRALAAAEPGPSSWVNLARVLAFQDRWHEAMAVIDAGLRRHPGDVALQGLRVLVARGTQLPQSGVDRTAVAAVRPGAQPAAADAAAVAAGLERARLALELGDPELARRVVDRLLEAYPADAHLVLARAFVDALDGRVDLARRRLLDVRQRDPAATTRWDAALAALDSVGGVR